MGYWTLDNVTDEKMKALRDLIGDELTDALLLSVARKAESERVKATPRSPFWDVSLKEQRQPATGIDAGFLNNLINGRK